MRRRKEDKIRLLCSQAIAEKDPEKFTLIITELRTALHLQVAELRKRLTEGTPQRREQETEAKV